MWYDAQSNGWTGSGSERHSQNWNSSTQSLSGGSQPDYSHITSFTGASTGDMFNVGQSYSMGGDVLVANSNGTFTNQRTGNTLEGSATNPDAKFYGYASLASSGGGGSGPASQVVATASGGGGAGPGSAVTNTGASSEPAASPAGSGAGSPVAISRAASDRASALRLEVSAPAKVTQLVSGGVPMNHDTGWSDGGEFVDRWGEWGGAIGGLFVMGADLWNHGVRVPAAEYYERHDVSPKPVGGDAWNTIIAPIPGRILDSMHSAGPGHGGLDAGYVTRGGF